EKESHLLFILFCSVCVAISACLGVVERAGSQAEQGQSLWLLCQSGEARSRECAGHHCLPEQKHWRAEGSVHLVQASGRSRRPSCSMLLSLKLFSFHLACFFNFCL